MRLSPHFQLAELIPAGMPFDDVPAHVLDNLTRLVVTILEPLRQEMGVPVVINSGWRPPVLNQQAGGVRHSDHLTGSAADFHVMDGNDESWELNTMGAYHWIKSHLMGKFGQLILEDHRHAEGEPGRLWVHVALPTERHPGIGPNTLLVSFEPGKYEPYDPATESRA